VTATRDASRVTREDCERVLAGLVGSLEQKPPMYSAVRVDGERLYERARRGEVVEREARNVTIRALTLESFEGGAIAKLRFTVECSKGTYVRTLGAEIGERLGVGAHLTALRRTRAGAFTLAHAIPQSDLNESTALLPLADALANFSTVKVPADLERSVRDGKLHIVADLTPTEGLSRLLTADGRLLAVARREGTTVSLERVFNS
jgi:tRNA pseudouridine55 synthase